MYQDPSCQHGEAAQRPAPGRAGGVHRPDRSGVSVDGLGGFKDITKLRVIKKIWINGPIGYGARRNNFFG